MCFPVLEALESCFRHVAASVDAADDVGVETLAFGIAAAARVGHVLLIGMLDL